MKKHFYWIDWLRFIAAFMVVVCHVRGHHWMDYANLDKGSHTFAIISFFALTRAGLEWVVVFFVLSGFLVGGGVISKVMNHKFDIIQFVIDRFSRIWIPLMPAFVLSSVVGLYCGISFSISTLVGNLLGLQGIFFDVFAHNAPLWSLSYEIWFYVLIGSIAVILKSVWRAKTIALIILLVSFAVFTKLNTSLLACWLLGGFCFFLISDSRNPWLLFFGVVIALVGMFLSQLQADSLSFTKVGLIKLLPSRDLSSLIESLGIGLLISSICTIVPIGQSWVSLEHLGTKLAAWSYTLYLTHYPILMLMDHFYPERYHSLTSASFLLFVLKILACLVSAWLLYLPFEAKTVTIRIWLMNQITSNRILENQKSGTNP